MNVKILFRIGLNIFEEEILTYDLGRPSLIGKLLWKHNESIMTHKINTSPMLQA